MLIIILFLSLSLSAELIPDGTQLAPPSLSHSSIKALKAGEVIVNSNLSNLENNQQSFEYQLSVLHPQNCQRAFSKLSLYEQFHSQMSFVKRSDYNDETKQIDFVFDHELMPFPISLRFQIPRIKGPGIYDFSFQHGFFKDLQGKVFVTAPGKQTAFNQGCMIQVNALWKGTHIGLAPLIFNAFSTTLSKLGSEKLLRYSRF